MIRTTPTKRIVSRLHKIVLAGLTIFSAGTFAGSINTSDAGCVTQNVNQYALKTDVWASIAGLPPGTYHIKVAYPGNPNDTFLGKGDIVITDDPQCIYVWDVVDQTDGNGNFLPGPIDGFGDSQNPAGVYKITIEDDGNLKKSDNFKIGTSSALGILCPSDITLPCQPDGTAVAFEPTVSGGTEPYNIVCTANFGPGHETDVVTSGSKFPCGTTTVTCTVTDSALTPSTASCTFTVTIEDSTAPVVSTTAGSLDVTLECSDTAGIALAVAAAPLASDNCSATVTPHLDSQKTPDANCANAYVQVRTWTFTDGCGNTSLPFTQTITVKDSTAPVVTTTAGSLDAVLECSDLSGLALVLASAPTATDNCTTTPTPHVQDASTPNANCGNAYVLVRTWTFTDGCGNTSLPFVQTITVRDTTPPVITFCPTGTDLGCNPTVTPTCDDVKAVVTATDNCSLTLTKNCSVVDSDNGCIHTRQFTITVSDGCQNTSAPCVVTYTWIIDNTGPVIAGCPLSSVLRTKTTTAGILITVTPPLASDGCNLGPVTVVGTRDDSQPLTAPYPCCTTTITWTATDFCGKQTICTQKVIVTCVYTPGGHTLGFWSNKNGQVLEDGADLCTLTALNLRTGNGAAYDPLSAAICAGTPTTAQINSARTGLSTWLLNADATSMAYMLSAQLAATQLSVLNGFTDPTVIVDVIGGVRNINQEIAYANSLLANPIVGGTFNGLNGSVTKTATALRAEQERVKNILDKINNGLSFTQPCP